MVELPRAAAEAEYDLARNTINLIQENARQDWSNSDDQVGFDVGKWNILIDRPEVLPEGGVGILNVNRMGTAEDFEAIAQSPKEASRDTLLWHVGQRMGDSFRRLIIERPANLAALAEARQAIWGEKQPQWWFKNYGNFGYTGAYPTTMGTYTIETSAMAMSDDAERIVGQVVSNWLRSRGILV